MEKNNKPAVIFSIVSLLFLVGGLVLAVRLGAVHIGFTDIYNSIFNYEEKLELMLLRDVRIPRALCVLFTGGILGVTGSMIQGVTRNPIAEPSALGISQGATLVIAIFYGTGIAISTASVMTAALIGAAVTGIIAFLLLSGRKGAGSVTSILLAGTALGTFFISLTTMIGLLTNQSQFIGFWVSGGFRNASWTDFYLVLITAVLGLMAAIMLSGKIIVLYQGVDVAIGLGQNPSYIRLMAFAVMIPMCAAAVAVGKNIAFVGLIIPLIVRRVVGEDYRKIIPCSFLLGAVFLTYADIGARLLFEPYEMPIGIFTALIGVPFFIMAARKERG